MTGSAAADWLPTGSVTVRVPGKVNLYLEVGDRSAGDAATYPDDDLQALAAEDKWRFAHKDGRPY